MQHIVGGMYATVVTGGNRPEYIGHGDTWYDASENNRTADWSDLDGSNRGDLVIAMVAPGGGGEPPKYIDAPIGTQYEAVH